MTPQSDLPLMPFVLASRVGAPGLLDRMHARGGHAVDTLGPLAETWFHWLWAANQEAFGGLGMPAWVQLDCATLPSGFVGFTAPREDLDEALVHRLVQRVATAFGSAAAGVLEAARHPLPVAAACQVPTGLPGRVTGISMWSLWPGQNLGLRAKALSLLLHEARYQVGVCSITSPALAVHARFGPLRVMAAGMPLHEAGAERLVYELEVPPTARLEGWLRGKLDPRPDPPGRAELVPLAEAIDWIRERLPLGPVHVLPPARQGEGASCRLVLSGPRPPQDQDPFS